MRISDSFRLSICRILLTAGLILASGCVFLVIQGFPVSYGPLHLKNLKKPTQLILILSLIYFWAHPARMVLTEKWKEKLRPWLETNRGAWILFGVASVLLTWRQITEYLSVQINFIPFMFYPAMLQRFAELGLFNFTGELHGSYHLNNLLYAFLPLWKLLPDPLLFVLILGPLLAAAVFPLYAIARFSLKESLVMPMIICLVYLNYSYFENLQFINFGIEAFYPVLLLTLFYWGLTNRRPYYFLTLFLTLLVKEDAFIYAGTVGLYFFFVKGKRGLGIWTMGLSLAYEILLLKCFVPWTGSSILRGNLNNFAAQGDTIPQILSHSFLNPAVFLKILFGDPQKIETYMKLLGCLLFLPLLSPAVLTIFPALIPPFMHMLGRDEDFFQLHYHYAAPVLAFVFFAFVQGLRVFLAWIAKFPSKTNFYIRFAVIFALLFVSAGKYRSIRFTNQNLESIAWAKSIPEDTNLVTHGQLLPYVGHRPYNYYFARPWTVSKTAVHREFMNADYYLFDYSVELYPWTKDEVSTFQKNIASRSNYELSRTDGTRFVYKRSAAR